MNAQLARAGAYSYTHNARRYLRFSGGAGRPMMRPLYAAPPFFALPPKGPQVGWQKMIPNSPSKAMTAMGSGSTSVCGWRKSSPSTVVGTPILVSSLVRDDGED